VCTRITDTAKPPQLVGQFAQGLAAVRNGVLLILAEFGTGLAEFRDKEIGVVAEAALSAWGVDDFAVPAALGDQRLGVVGIAHQHHHAVVVRAAAGLPREGGDELFVVARIGFRLARIAGGIHAGRAVERLDADTGVVGQRRQAGMRAGMARLGEAVLDEGDVRLGAFGDAEVGLRRGFDPERFEDARDFAQFAGVAGCDNEFIHGFPF
jgi:hypothetical protein